jgi:Short C-terminal domain
MASLASKPPSNLGCSSGARIGEENLTCQRRPTPGLIDEAGRACSRRVPLDPASAPDGLVADLVRLADLRAAGTLSDAEFAEAKARLLGSSQAGIASRSLTGHPSLLARRHARTQSGHGGALGGIAGSGYCSSPPAAFSRSTKTGGTVERQFRFNSDCGRR